MGAGRRGLAAGLTVLALLAVASGAAAQQDDTERARELFVEGVDLAEQGHWHEAADRFRRTLELKSTPQVKYNLALALQNTGELTRAAELLEEVEQSEETDRRLKRDARRTREELEPKLGSLTVSVAGDPAGASVTLDGEELPPEDWDRSIAADPGTHELVLSARGRESSRQTVTVEEGGSAEVTLVPGPEAAARSAVDPELLAEQQGEDEGGGGIVTEWWFWTAIGAVVVIGAAVAIGVAAGGGGGSPDPAQGDLDPPILQVTP